jgi:ectoine hydroxylase-related dioxygenase (phytanoyl-CoA dioxygenase family)
MTEVGVAEGLLNAQRVAEYRREGFIKLPSVLDAASLAMLHDVCVATETEGPGGLIGEATDDESLAGRFKYHNDERYSAMWSNAFDLRLRFGVVADIVARLADVARALLGDDDVKVFWDKTFVKPPASEGTRESVWHQDFPYNPIDRRGMLTIWVALEDVPAESGALRFVPRSHHLGPLGRLDLVSQDYELDDILRSDDFDLVGDAVTVPLLAGDATAHDALTLHGAGPNLTDRPRRAWTVVFMPGSTRYIGGPHPHEAINSLGLVPFERFDHPRFSVPGSRPVPDNSQ